MDNRVRLLAGQRLMLGFDGIDLNPELEQVIGEFHAGGIILFRPNIQSPDQLKRLCADAQAFARSCGLPPLFIAVDQEGGTVARLRAPFTEFPGNPHIHTPEAAEDFARITARELTGAGINMNLAPVLDVAPDGMDSIMRDRAFPGDADAVSRLGTRVISVLQSNGIMAVAKHFPGIGRTVLDSHHHLPVLDADPASLWDNDLIPFQAARDADVVGIMLSHISYPRLDPVWQASLSPAIARDLVRDQLGFDGLVLTDDMDMKAVSLDIATCMAQVLASDIDVTLICHAGPDIGTAYHEIKRLLSESETLRARGEECLNRIFRYKRQYLGDWG